VAALYTVSGEWFARKRDARDVAPRVLWQAWDYAHHGRAQHPRGLFAGEERVSDRLEPARLP